jgi:hypothetical protein
VLGMDGERRTRACRVIADMDLAVSEDMEGSVDAGSSSDLQRPSSSSTGDAGRDKSSGGGWRVRCQVGSLLSPTYSLFCLA